MSRSRRLRLPHRMMISLALTTVVLVESGRKSGAQDSPAATADSPARCVPRDGHLAYVEFDGLDAHAAAWKKSAAYRILNDTPTGAMLEDLYTQISARYVRSGNISAAESLLLLKHVLKSGFFLDLRVDDNPTHTPHMTVVVRNGFSNKEVRPVFARLLQKLAPAGTKAQSVVKGGHTLVSGPFGPPGSTNRMTYFWWVEETKKNDLILMGCDPDRIEANLEAIDGTKPSLLDNPSYQTLSKREAGIDRTGIVAIDPSPLKMIEPKPEMVTALEAIGLDRLELTTGFQDDAMLTTGRIQLKKTDGAGSLSKLLDDVVGPPFDKGAMAGIPTAATNFSVVSLNLKNLVEKLPAAKAAFDQVLANSKDKSKLRLGEDFVAHLGPKIATYLLPSKTGSAPGIGLPNALNLMSQLGAGGVDNIPRVAVLIDLANAAAFGKSLDELMIIVNRSLKTAYMAPPGGGNDAPPPPPPGGPRGRGPGAPPFPEFRVMSGESKSYVFTVPPELSNRFPASFRPTIRLGAKQVAIALSADVARQALEAKGAYTPPAELTGAFGQLPAKLNWVMVVDPRESTPEILASLPAKLQAGINTATIPATSPPNATAASPAAPTGGNLPSTSGPGSRGARGGMMIASGPASAGPGDGPPAAAPGAAAGAAAPTGPLVLQVDPSKLPAVDDVKKLLFPRRRHPGSGRGRDPLHQPGGLPAARRPRHHRPDRPDQPGAARPQGPGRPRGHRWIF